MPGRNLLRRRWPNLLIGIGNSFHDAEAYGANQMLTVIVNPSARSAYGPHAFVFRDWTTADRFFAANRAVLTRPETLLRAIRGQIMLLRSVAPWAEPCD